MYKTLLFHLENDLAVLKLNRPESLNSINEEMHRELRDALKQVKSSSARALLLTGEGKGFCSGQDLSDRHITPDNDGTVPPDLGASLEKYYNPLVNTLCNLPIPIVCAVNGVAAGAGVSLVLSADIILMAESASLVLAFSKIGLVPDSGCSWLLSQSIGWRKARAISLLGEKITSQQAHEWGIAWRVIPDIDLDRESMAMAEQLRDSPTLGLGYTKRIFKEMRADLSEQLELERDMQRLAGRTHDYREGVTAFIGKRKPKFQGR